MEVRHYSVPGTTVHTHTASIKLAYHLHTILSTFFSFTLGGIYVDDEATVDQGDRCTYGETNIRFTNVTPLTVRGLKIGLIVSSVTPFS